ncbi:hypothetical protein KKH13_04735 [Patescibacteria group bacterium]|uniref:Putative uracil DNA glycosylase superfamily protein n=1 Tax=viral metagenome TaxID=1070528 RepID=A0A6M3KPT0_9ZZZZ|nr:hypothetical protein [Patescibacteria group bacterium]
MPKLVPGIGSLNSKIVLIGEAPGATEEQQGKPFVGQVGYVLDKLLAESGLNRNMCYITNVVKERPPNNDIKPFIDLSKKTPYVSQLGKIYLNSLYEELAETKANIFVPIGDIALFALTGLKHITKWRGSILTSISPKGVKTIPIIHPAAILRNYMFIHPTKIDLRRIAKECEFPEIALSKRALYIDGDFDTAVAYVSSCMNVEEIGFDIETSRDQVTCLAIAKSPYEAVCIPFYSKGKHVFSEVLEASLWYEVAKLLSNPNVTKIGQNIHFDASFLFDRYGIITNNIEDTMIAHSVLMPDLPKGLDFLTSIYTREPYYKDEGKRWFKLGMDDDEFFQYNAKDAAIVMEIWPILKHDLERQGNLEAYQRQRDLQQPLMYIQTKGFRLNNARLERRRIAAVRLVDYIVKKFHQEIKDDTINPASPKQLMDFYYIKIGIKPYISRQTHKPTIDEEALKRLARRNIIGTRILLSYRYYAKFLGTYLDVKLDSDGRLRGSFNIVGTTSGRLSSSKSVFGTGMNMQTLPGEMKVFLEAD